MAVVAFPFEIKALAKMATLGELYLGVLGVILPHEECCRREKKQQSCSIGLREVIRRCTMSISRVEVKQSHVSIGSSS